MAEAPRRGNPPSRRDQEYRAEQEQVPVADQNGTRFPSTILTNRVRVTSDARRLLAPTDVRVPLNDGPGWSASADNRSYADLLLDSLSLDEQSHEQGAESRDPRLDEWRRDNLSAEEWLRIEGETGGERYLDALRRENAAVRRQSDILREATEKMRADMFHINPNAGRE